MRHGIVLFTCGGGITPAGAAKAAEERGFEAFYVSDPVTLAKTIATLDHLSGGRVTVGAGFGWNADELAEPVQAHVPAVPTGVRWRRPQPMRPDRRGTVWRRPLPGRSRPTLTASRAASRSDHAP